jgi:hypothetical protein
MTDHKLRVEYPDNRLWWQAHHRRMACGCGWAGPWRPIGDRHTSDADWTQHVEAVRT